MPSVLDFSGQLALYKSYHFNKVNVAIHLVCIPIIFFTTTSGLSTVNLLGDAYPQVNLGSVFATSYGIYYILLDWKAGVPAAAGLLVFVYFSKVFYLGLADGPPTGFSGLLAKVSGSADPFTKGEFLKALLAAHVLAWLAQFYGHGVHEKRAPALIDNLLQAVVLAPFFVFLEVLFFFGFRHDVEKSMLNTAGVMRRDYITKSKPK